MDGDGGIPDDADVVSEAQEGVVVSFDGEAFILRHSVLNRIHADLLARVDTTDVESNEVGDGFLVVVKSRA